METALHSAQPVVLRSLQHLRDTVPGLTLPETLPLTPSGATFVMAQELTWLDAAHFAVGRWDGSLSIFRFTRDTTQGSMMSTVINTPSAEGVQMITLLGTGCFATSNDERSALIWQANEANWRDVVQTQTLHFAAELGVANAGVSLPDLSVEGDASAAADSSNSSDRIAGQDGRYFLVLGHANGFISIWRYSLPLCSAPQFVRSVDLRSATPSNPWQIHNIRGVAYFAQASDAENAYIVSGSEDGDICIVRVPDGEIVCRSLYNRLAQRGINSIALRGTRLLLGNCAVGAQDKNLWVYEIDTAPWRIRNTDSARLVVDQTRPQVFDFDVIWGEYGAGPCWYAATEEGYLWMGGCNQAGQLSLIGRQSLSGELGAAIGQSTNGDLACAAYNVHEFETLAAPA